jgi:class 3 adenylate cyclase
MSNRQWIGAGASEDRLRRLIEDRMRPGADKERIDKRIWDLFGETWCVMFTDLSGFSRQVQEFGIIHFLQTIHSAEKELVPLIDQHDGILLKTEGDSMLVIFRNSRKALACAIAMEQHLDVCNAATPAQEDILLCIGLGFGPVLRIGDADVFGAQVNAASKLGEDTAGPREVLVTGAVKDEVGDLQGIEWEQIDEVPPGADAAWKAKYDLHSPEPLIRALTATMPSLAPVR